MTASGQAQEDGDSRVIEVKSPDYHLTPDSPLWASTHVHTYAGPPAISIHSGLEVGVVLFGQEEIQLDDRVIPGDPGDVWLCAMSEPHRYRVLQPNTVNLVLVFLPSFLGEEMLGDKPWLTLFAAPPRDRPRVATDETRSTAISTADEIRREVAQRLDGWECAVRLNLLRLLFYLSRGWTSPGGGESGGVRQGNLRRIMPVLAMLHADPTESLSRAEAARACGLGPSRFTMLFHETMGVSFRTFRRRTRIAFAANLLLTTELSMDTIADRSGFSDASHLHRSFVQEYGCTPGEYRAQSRLPVVRRFQQQADPWSDPGSVSIEQADAAT
jgi:AraC-like DNA-binding protein